MNPWEIYVHIGNGVLIIAVAFTNLMSVNYALKRIREVEAEHDRQLSLLRNATASNTRGVLGLVQNRIEELNAIKGKITTLEKTS